MRLGLLWRAPSCAPKVAGAARGPHVPPSARPRRRCGIFPAITRRRASARRSAPPPASTTTAPPRPRARSQRRRAGAWASGDATLGRREFWRAPARRRRRGDPAGRAAGARAPPGVVDAVEVESAVAAIARLPPTARRRRRSRATSSRCSSSAAPSTGAGPAREPAGARQPHRPHQRRRRAPDPDAPLSRSRDARARRRSRRRCSASTNQRREPPTMTPCACFSFRPRSRRRTPAAAPSAHADTGTRHRLPLQHGRRLEPHDFNGVGSSGPTATPTSASPANRAAPAPSRAPSTS